MAGEAPAAASLQVIGSSDWQCAKQELMKSPLLLEPAKRPLTDATIWSLKPECACIDRFSVEIDNLENNCCLVGPQGLWIENV